MLQNYRWYKLYFFILLLIISCGNPLPEIQGVDLQTWKNDNLGCQGIRKNSIDAFRDQKNKFLGLSEMEIIKLLGRPDENELYKRNQKFYHYYLEPSLSCNSSNDSAFMLTIRFNAMGLAKEVAVGQSYVPLP